ncbi:hypothetical protein [Billgrantia gudaonensis]|uniref:Uncharacterized protein n=1 Tax=Billgrantia gudaonensis TaxID=376427 RepID=A0A1G8W7M5_9GAMM|nr:hypothetical protein [Halomonas gudaonensis]SDJ74097.1 hypothetical protein SAMN04487954_107176 [Halomonas gudaonensis]
MNGMARRVIAVLAMALLSGVTGQAMARDYQLMVGNSPSQYVGGTYRYQLQLDDPAEVRIDSELLPAGFYDARLRAVLRDERGNVVAESARRGDNFTLVRTLQPGRYVLEVHGQHLGGDDRGFFRLRTSMH